jgi:mannose-6-phosphate isomerase
MNPAVLPPNPVARFYRGGPAIAALRGAAPDGDGAPEDWVGSTTEVLGDPSAGPSRLADGRLLRDVIAADPDAWLGPEHVARWGADPALLVKLLDAGERLPVHAHPDGPFAREHLGTRFGKTEAWIVIDGEGHVRLGWREPVDAATLRDWVERQDAEAMRAALHRIDVGPGDALFVPAGVPHSIGAGLLIAELQEPSDMSIVLEWRGHGIADEHEATLGLGRDTALAAIGRDATHPATLVAEAGDGPVRGLLPRAADPFFRAEALHVDGVPIELEPGFAVLLVLDGQGRLDAPNAAGLSLTRGDNAVIPYSAGPTRLSGALRAVRCLPPQPDAPEVPTR